MPRPINEKLEEAIEQIANENKTVTMALTTRDIKERVQKQFGLNPATSTIARVLRRLGISNDEHSHHWKWVSKSNEGNKDT